MAGLADRILQGDVRAASRLMRDIDDGLGSAIGELRALFPRTGRAYVVGITGPPGAGKSTLADRLISHYRKAGKTVGVIAVDPTSPFTGGAILGDRIRMQDHAMDPGVFIRSLATRGNLGGLSRATGDCIHVMDAMGREIVLVETVGVGQDEIDIAQMAHTTVLVTVPGMGDDIQAIKAGILEVADVFAVNKADLEGADRAVRELKHMLELRQATMAPGHVDHDAAHRMRRSCGAQPAKAAAKREEATWEPPVLKTVASKDEGTQALAEAIEAHRRFLDSSGMRQEKEKGRAAAQFLALLREQLVRSALSRLERERGRLDEVAARIAAREADPYELAQKLASQLSE